MSSKIKLILRSSSFRVIQTIVNIIVGFLMMPFLINTLGNDMYGLWVVIGSVVSSFYLLDFGFSQAVTRFVTKYIHLKNFSEANKIINTSLLIYSLLGFIILIITIIASQYVTPSLIKNAENVPIAQLVLLVSGIAMAIEFPTKSFTGIISAYMRHDFIAKVNICKIIIDAILMYLLLSNGYGIVAIAVVTFVTGFISSIIYILFTTNLFKDFELSRNHVNIKTTKSIFHFSKWVFIVDMTAMIQSKVDIWFIAYYLSSSTLTVYYVAVRLAEYASVLLAQATGITGPIFTELYVKKEYNKLNMSVALFLKINVILSSIFLIGFYQLGESFVIFWMGESFDANQVQACLMVLVVGRFSKYLSTPLYSLLLTVNKHQICSWISLIETISSAILCWVLIPKYHILGAAISVSIPYLIGRLIAIPYFTSKLLDIKLMPIIFYSILFLVASILCANILSIYIDQKQAVSIYSILGFAIMITILQILLSPLIFSTEERKLILTKLNEKLSSLRKNNNI